MQWYANWISKIKLFCMLLGFLLLEVDRAYISLTLIGEWIPVTESTPNL
jgi:hypothetical protein